MTSPTMWSMTANACSTGRSGTRARSRSLSSTIRLLHASRSASSPRRAASWRWASARNGIVATPTTTAPAIRAQFATSGARPVPVPPPRPAITNVRSPPHAAARTSFSCNAAKRAPISGRPPVPRTGHPATTRPSALRGLDRLRDPAPHVLPHGVPDRVLDRDGVAGLHELLQVDDVPLGKLDRELADVVRGALLVDEAVAPRAA